MSYFFTLLKMLSVCKRSCRLYNIPHILRSWKWSPGHRHLGEVQWQGAELRA